MRQPMSGADKVGGMIRGIALALAVAASLGLGLLVDPPRAEAKACGDLRVKHIVYIVGGAGLSCDLQRRWV